MLQWSAAEAQRFGLECQQAKHAAHEAGGFSDDALASLIDAYPREKLQAFTMGTNPEQLEDLVPVDTAGISGRDVLVAIRKGKIWFKLQRIDKWAKYGEVVGRLYADLQEECPGFRPHGWSAVLIISSPGGLMYFHADAKPNMLWHMRGEKAFTVYPNGHRTLISQENMEDIFANAVDEEVPYRPEFEAHAQTFTLKSGDFLAWPQNTPHVVRAVGPLNVSISSFHETDEGDRRANIYGFNRFMRTRLGIKGLSVGEQGPIAAGKALGYKVLRKAGVVAPHMPNREYMAHYKLDPASPNGITKIAGGPVRTEFR